MNNHRSPLALLPLVTVTFLAIAAGQVVAEVPDTVVLWNKLGSETEILNSEVGVDGEIIAPLGYQPVQHGNGVALESGSAQVKFSNLFGTSFPDAGTIEFWWIPAHDENSGTTSHYDERSPLWLSSDEKTPTNWPAFAIGLRYHCCDNMTRTGIQAGIYDGDTGTWYSYGQQYDVDFLAGQLIHTAIVWDKSWGADPMKVYFDGVETAPVFTGPENSDQFIEKVQEKMADPAYTYDLELLRRSKRPDGAAGQYDPEMYVDNVKVFDYAKDDFSDRFIEGFETPDVPAASNRGLVVTVALLLAGSALVLRRRRV